MTTFQAVVYSVLHAFTQFLPLSPEAHHRLVPFFIGWPEPSGAFAGALSLGALIAVLIYFSHDWAAIISSFLQIVIFRRKPMTLDERMPFFLALAMLPTSAAWYYLRDFGHEWFSDPLRLAGSVAAFGALLWFADYSTRKTKGMFDWNWLDSSIVGAAQGMMALTGCGALAGSLSGALLRNYGHEPAAKFALLLSAPVLAAETVSRLSGMSFSDHAPMADLSWLTFWVTVVVTTLVSLLVVGGFMKQVQKKSFVGYSIYRFLLAGSVAAMFWFRTKGI